MWVIASCGFFTAVVTPDDQVEGMVTVRVRLSADMDGLRQKYMPALGPTLEKYGRDYPYSARISRGEFAEGMKRIALGLDYPDFQAMVLEEEGANRARVYGKVWRDLMELDSSTANEHDWTQPRIAWRVARAIQKFRCLYHCWPTHVDLPKGFYDLLFLDIGQLWHEPMLAKLSFGLSETGIMARDEEGHEADYDPVFCGTIDHREAFEWMFQS